MSQSVAKEKAETYDELREQFANDEISESEFEKELDELFESGDDFLNHEPESEPIVDKSSVMFRVKEITEIVFAFGSIAVFFYLLYITNGIILPLTIPLGAVIVLYYMGAFR